MRKPAGYLILTVALVFGLAFVFTGCDDGDNGPRGPKGDEGEDGTAGQDGADLTEIPDPSYDIVGHVLDRLTESPVEGVAVSTLGGSGEKFSATTDANGVFTLVGVPLTSLIQIRFEHEGYVPQITPFETPGGIEEWPNAQPNMVLTEDFMIAPLDTQTGFVFTYFGGPVEGVEITMQTTDNFGGGNEYPTQVATTDADGMVVFDTCSYSGGSPAKADDDDDDIGIGEWFNYQLYVPPIDLDGDGALDSEGGWLGVSSAWLGFLVTVSLDDLFFPFDLIDTSLGAGPTFNLFFSEDLDPDDFYLLNVMWSTIGEAVVDSEDPYDATVTGNMAEVTLNLIEDVDAPGQQWYPGDQIQLYYFANSLVEDDGGWFDDWAQGLTPVFTLPWPSEDYCEVQVNDFFTACDEGDWDIFEYVLIEVCLDDEMPQCLEYCLDVAPCGDIADCYDFCVSGGDDDDDSA